jgi:formylglycine-generating enzyme required for sulfatase activity
MGKGRHDFTRGSKQTFPWGDQNPDQDRANLFENGLWSVSPIGAFPDGQNIYGCQQMIGDVWEWTTSDYTPYPGFKSEFDEYNDNGLWGRKSCAADPSPRPAYTSVQLIEIFSIRMSGG